MILRGLGIWAGVGLGHLAVLGALWSGSAAPTATAPLTLDLRFVSPSADLPAAPTPFPAADLGAELPAIPSSPRPLTPAPVIAAATAPVEAAPASPPAGLPAATVSPSALAASPVAPPVLALPPRFLDRAEPIYPARARRAGVEGAVTLALRLSERGELIDARILRGSGSELLDEAALAAARASRFEPASLDGRPVGSETEATYRFLLR